jgi:hypothetical protein
MTRPVGKLGCKRCLTTRMGLAKNEVDVNEEINPIVTYYNF